MDDPSLLPFLNNNGNGHHYSHGAMSMDSEIEHEEDELDEDDVPDDDDDDDDVDETERNPVYPEDEIEEDEIDEDEIDDEQEIVLPPPPPPPPPLLSSVTEQLIQSERGGRRKGVPRRLQISPQTANAAAAAAALQQRLLPPLSTTKNCSSNDQPILTSDQEDNEDLHNHPATSLSLDFFSQHLNGNSSENFDENNNNNHYYEEENTLEIVDDILAELVTNIVRDIRQQRQITNGKQQPIIPHKINGHAHSKPITNGISKSIMQKHEPKLSNGKSTIPDLVSTNSIKSSKSQCQQSLNSSPGKVSDSSTLFHELTKMMHLNSQQQLVKHKHSFSPSSPSSSSTTKRQKISETSSPSAIQQHHQQLLWQMTQQFLMSPQATDIDSSSLLKQQLLGLTPPGAQPKRPGRPPKQPAHPQVMRSSTNMAPPISHSSASTSSFERASFAPRRRGRPPKYVTERGGHSALPPSHDLDQSSFDQLFAAIENNNGNGNSGRTSSAAFQSALASMLGHQAGLSIPPPPPPPPPPVSIAPPPLPSAIRNGTPASMMKQSAGQTRHSLPSSSSLSKAAKISRGMIGGGNALESPLMATKKRGPGRPPKNQTLVDSHQVVHATKRMNSSLSNNNNNNNNNNNFPPTMVPSSHSPFDLNAAFVEMLQQQQQLQHPR